MEFYIYAVGENRQGWSDRGIWLLCGIEKFDASRGFKISTYVYWCIHQLPYEDMTPFQATVVVVQKIDWIYMGLTLLVLKEKERAWLAGDHVSVHIFFMGHVTCHVRLYNF
ncbi:uncharacterized protein [Zea mays]|uniref:Uncharacterized protein n=1 Tax=Zea mays TaxID=4577 RepID=A0A804PAQ6_MAIZE|nr:uncharacterized protein LOC103626155 isoform X2 [Zea mays]